MNASELFKNGKLQEAINAQIEVVKSKPADHSQRLFLFELLAFMGDLDRAGRQIDAVQYGEMELDAATQNYRLLVDAERKRRRVFQNQEQPQFLVDAPEHARLRLQALAQLTAQPPQPNAELLSQADSATPPISGQLNNKPFAALRDADDRFGAVLEVMARGNYFWVPMDQVAALATNPPKFPRDLLWLPARLEMQSGESGEVFLPTLYPGSHTHADVQIKLGRLTDWVDGPGDTVQGVGLHLLLVDDNPVSLLDCRELTISAAS